MAAPLISYPFRVAASGAIASSLDGTDPQVAEELIVACLTRPDERPLVPDFGIADPVFAGFDGNALRLHVELFGPPVNVDSVDIEFLDDDRQDVVVSFSTNA